MKIYKDIIQQSPEWFEVKKLHFSASHASTILACGKGLDTLIKEMLSEYFSSAKYEEYTSRYKNLEMQRGCDFEDMARQVYQLETQQQVEQVGFIEIDENIGCSPDGLVGEDGLIEIKNHNDNVFTQLMLDHKINKQYRDQMQMQLYVTGRKWCDYFGFNPNFEPCYVKIRVYPDPEIQCNLRRTLAIAKKKLNEEKEILDNLLKVSEK